MLLRLRVRDLVLASWPTDAARIARVLPPGLAPAEIEGRHLVSIAAFRCPRGRLGPLPVPPFSQLNLRAYVEAGGQPGVFFLGTRVTWPGMGGALFGAPYRPARIGIGPGSVEAPGLGVSIRYEPRGPVEPGPLAGHVLGLFEAAGLRSFRIRRGAAAWQWAEPADEARADPLLALGFELAGPPDLLYAGRAELAAELPPRRFP